MIKNLTIIFLIFVMPSYSFSQEEEILEGATTMVEFNYGSGWSGADMADRFGRKNMIGTGISYMSSNNIISGISLNYFFGSNINEDVLSNLRNAEGNILGFDGFESIVFLRERGFNIGVSIGKIFSFKERSKSGIRVTLGVGMMQHWVRVQDESRTIVQVKGDYKYGYDHKTRGVSINEFIGYQFLSADKRINFYCGFDLYQGFTKNVRPINFNTTKKDDESRLDLIYGLKVGFILPFHGVDNPEEIFY